MDDADEGFPSKRWWLLLFITKCLGFLAFVIGWIAMGWRTGLVAATVVNGVGLLCGVIYAYWRKRVSLLEVSFPTGFAVSWSILLYCLKLTTGSLSVLYFIASGIILSGGLWVQKSGKIERVLLVFPTSVFLYEMVSAYLHRLNADLYLLVGDAIVAVAVVALFTVRSIKDKSMPESVESNAGRQQ